MTIQDNQMLTKIAFPQLRTVGEDVTLLISNSMMTFLFPSLVTVGDALFFEFIGSLTVAAFPRLESVGGWMNHRYSSALTFQSFPRLRSINGALRLNSNGGLQSLHFPHLETISAGLIMRENNVLSRISFRALRNIEGIFDYRPFRPSYTLLIEGHPSLELSPEETINVQSIDHNVEEDLGHTQNNINFLNGLQNPDGSSMFGRLGVPNDNGDPGVVSADGRITVTPEVVSFDEQ